MSRYTGPTTRLNRRFGMAIFPANKAFERRPFLPGQHGPRLRRKMSEYSLGLNEKQKLRFMYGLTEKQFRRTFEQAKRVRGVTGENFLTLLETRLDNVIYRMGFARTRRASRQFVTHGHICINGHKVDIPSYQVKAGDEVTVRERSSSRQLATANIEDAAFRTPPSWLSVLPDQIKGQVTRMPSPEELETGINIQLIVEFYSR